MIPLSVPSLTGNELRYVTECIESGWVSSTGPFVTRFEKEIAACLRIPHTVACVNGTAALHIALLLSGVARGDEVIVPTLTFIAPINTVRYVGAEPVFMDCDDRLGLNPEKLADFLRDECECTEAGVRNVRTGKWIRAIIVVHAFGHPANLAPILDIAKAYRLKVIEDATESLGSYYLDSEGRRVMTGTQGDFGCFSFNGNKIITTGGGGMIVTASEAQAKRAHHLTTQAKADVLYFRHDEVGYNYRLTNIQAALGVAQLEQLEQFIAIKRKNFQTYQDAVSDISGLSFIPEPTGCFSNYWHYALVVARDQNGQTRDDLLQYLMVNNVYTRPVWALCHTQMPYRHNQAYRIERAPWFERRIINLPCSTSLTDAEMRKITDHIKRFYAKS